MVDAATYCSTYNILQRFHPFEVGPGWPETWAMEKKNRPRVMYLALKSAKKQKCVFSPSNAQKRRQLEKALMLEKAEILRMLEDAGMDSVSFRKSTFFQCENNKN